MTPRWLFRLQPWTLIAVLAAYIVAGVWLSVNIPLGEAPDEQGHFNYTDFIARNGRLPNTVAERQSIGYRADKPPLFPLAASLAVKLAADDQPPQALRAIGEHPFDVLVTDGFASYRQLHTIDERPPFTGVVRAWHAARLVSLLFGVLTLVTVYWALSQVVSPWQATLGVALLAAMPQMRVIGAVMNDDTLVAFFVALFLGLALPLLHRPGGWKRYLLLGIIAGLALTAKYSALFLTFDLVLIWLLARRWPGWKNILFFGLGALFGAGWWFGFIIVHFNYIESYGLVRGVLAAVLLSGVDISSQRVAGFLDIGGAKPPDAPSFSTDWLAWTQHLFSTFWYYLSLAQLWNLPLLALTLGVWGKLTLMLRRWSAHAPVIGLMLGHSILFLPLLLLRFQMSGNIAETAQGRHLFFPTVLPLAFLLLVGVSQNGRLRRAGTALLTGLVIWLIAVFSGQIYPDLTFADLDDLPVTVKPTAAPAIPLDVSFGDVTLRGLTPGSLQPDTPALPLTLMWHAANSPVDDYDVHLQLFDAADGLVGQWRGQPLDGRYPTRAWLTDETVLDTVWIPALPQTTVATVAVTLLDRHDDPLTDTLRVSLPPLTIPAAAELRILPATETNTPPESIRFRRSVSVWLPAEKGTPQLRAPDGQLFQPALLLANKLGTLAQFTIGWAWPLGIYDLLDGQGSLSQAGLVTISGNQRLTTPPPSAYPLDANFGGQLRLLGYDLPQNRVAPGGEFPVTLTWQALQPMATDYKIFNHLLWNDNWQQHGGRDRTPQNFYQTVLWQPGEVVVDAYVVPVSSNAPPGVYWLDVGVYPIENPTAPLPLVLADQSQVANSVRLGPVKVGGQPLMSLPAAPPETTLNTTVGSALSLRGYTLSRDDTALDLALQWDVVEPLAADYTLFVHLLDAQGQILAQADAPPLDGRYPTSLWDAGETIFDRRSIPWPASGVPTTLHLGWYNPLDGTRLAVDGDSAGVISIPLGDD